MVVQFLEVSVATKDTRESSICQSKILKFTRIRVKAFIDDLVERGYAGHEIQKV